MSGPGRADGVHLSVRVTPRASKNEVAGWRSGALHVRVTAPPVDEKANEAVLALLARVLGAPRSALTVAGGAHGRSKTVRVRGLSMETIEARLATASAPE